MFKLKIKNLIQADQNHKVEKVLRKIDLILQIKLFR
jgi:hypothetical protein